MSDSDIKRKMSVVDRVKFLWIISAYSNLNRCLDHWLQNGPFWAILFAAEIISADTAGAIPAIPA